MDYSHILKHARITEKAGMLSVQSVYVFDIAERATKRDVARAISAMYKVTPAKIAVVAVPSKRVRHMRTGRSGIKQGGKKAYVYLKKGDTITLD
jgi:large subunit ribosomal protein L23